MPCINYCTCYVCGRSGDNGYHLMCPVVHKMLTWASVYEVDRHLIAISREVSKPRDSSLAFSIRSDAPVKFRSGSNMLTLDLAASRYREILRLDVLTLRDPSCNNVTRLVH